MSNFVINYCALKACQHWRLHNKCSKDGLPVTKQSLGYLANIHDNSKCEIRRQIDKYRLENLLENE